MRDVYFRVLTRQFLKCMRSTQPAELNELDESSREPLVVVVRPVPKNAVKSGAGGGGLFTHVPIRTF